MNREVELRCILFCFYARSINKYEYEKKIWYVLSLRIFQWLFWNEKQNKQINKDRKQKQTKQTGNNFIPSFIFNVIPVTENKLFKEEVGIWDGSFQFLVGEFCCLCWAGVAFSSAVFGACAMSLRYKASLNSEILFGDG